MGEGLHRLCLLPDPSEFINKICLNHIKFLFNKVNVFIPLLWYLLPYCPSIHFLFYVAIFLLPKNTSIPRLVIHYVVLICSFHILSTSCLSGTHTFCCNFNAPLKIGCCIFLAATFLCQNRFYMNIYIKVSLRTHFCHVTV